MTPMLPGLKPRRMHLHLLDLNADRYFGERQHSYPEAFLISSNQSNFQLFMRFK
jgi:hypothetical protein